MSSHPWLYCMSDSLASLEEQYRALMTEEELPQELSQYMKNLERMRDLRERYLDLVARNATDSTSPSSTPAPP